MQNYQTNLFFTTQENGNLAFHVGDNKKNVIQNHTKLAQKHNYKLTHLIHMKQIHSDTIHIVTQEDNFYSPPTCDALLTNIKGIALMVMVADCTPIILRDEMIGVIGVIHAGRAGAFQNIVSKTLLLMQDKFHSHIEDIQVAIGPSIGVCCYEVGQEIYDEAKELKLAYSVKQKGEKFYLDVGKIIDSQLRESGILNTNIQKSNICNCCHKVKYYSYRASQKTGRFAGVVQLL